VREHVWPGPLQTGRRSPADAFVISGILPQLARAFDISLGVAGRMVTTFAVGYALLAPMPTKTEIVECRASYCEGFSAFSGERTFNTHA
jgi:hypothetical protein